jgi:glycerol uptake facilitator-like aquaporin
LAPLAIGSALMIMVYAGGHISGGHYNSAATIAVWLRGKCPASDVPGYIASQVVGGIAAAVVALYLKGNPTVTAAEIKMVPALVAEFLGTFAPCYVVLNVATATFRCFNPDDKFRDDFRAAVARSTSLRHSPSQSLNRYPRTGTCRHGSVVL